MLVENWMATNVIAVKPDTSLLKCRNLLKEHQIRRLPVVEGGKLVGMLSLADMARRCDMEAAAALADISSNLRRAAPPKKSEEN